MLTEIERSLLLVEDDEATAELEKRALTRAGWSVQVAPLVGVAVDLLRRQSFRVVVTDYRLPDGEPWPLVEAARLKIPRIPVVMVTAMGSEKVAAEALHHGVSDYVKKAAGFWQELPRAVDSATKAAAVEQGLHLNDKLFHLIAANISDVIVAANLSGEVTYISPACQFVLGYQPQELNAALSLELVHSDDRSRVVAFLRDIEQRGQNTITFRCRTKGGEFRWIESNVNPSRDQANGNHQLIAISRDVTERKSAEEQITELNSALESRVEELKTASDALVLARERADAANHAKSDFLAAMSHEIRTPMNAILGMTDLLKDSALDGIQSNYVERCQSAGESLLTLINDILDLSKIEAGRFVLENISFDLEDLVEKTAEMVALKAQAKGVSFTLRIDPETPLKLVGDPRRLQQILLNLLSNAVKFTQAGEIRLTVAPQINASSGHVRFDVTDTGIGIPPDKLDAIFDDFSQADSSTTRRFGGTGLGLGIARRLVECMNGRLTVSSELGKGSAFRFNAVFSIDGNPQETEVSKVAPDLVGSAVLLIDENPSHRRVLHEMTLGLGLAPVAAASADEAKDLVTQALQNNHPFALAILDVSPPGGDGFDIVRQIRAINSDIPVIVTAGQSHSGDADKARELRVSGVAAKPVRRRELARLINAALRPAETETEKRQPRGPSVTATRVKPKESSGPVKILIAEDSEDNRFLVEAYLHDRAYALKFVENGVEALRSFEEGQTFDLVLMDVQMPVMDGLTATKLIRSFETQTQRPHTPILALTADALMGDEAKSQAAGCDTHLAKPISKETLVAAIENFVLGPS